MPLFKLSEPFVYEIDADISLPCLTIAGTMGAHGELTIPLLRISGKMQDVINGEIRLWGLQIDGEVGVSAQIDGDISLPALSIAGDMQAEGEIVLHAIRINGFLQSQGVITGEVTIPSFRVDGSVSVQGAINGDLELPLLQVAGTLVQDSAARIEGAITLPLLRIEGVLIGSGAYNYGSETDVTLRYDAARRHI